MIWTAPVHMLVEHVFMPGSRAEPIENTAFELTGVLSLNPFMCRNDCAQKHTQPAWFTA